MNFVGIGHIFWLIINSATTFYELDLTFFNKREKIWMILKLIELVVLSSVYITYAIVPSYTSHVFVYLLLLWKNGMWCKFGIHHFHHLVSCSIQSRHQCSLHLFHIMKTEKVHIQNNLFRNFCKRKKCAFSSAWWSAQSNHSIVASIETTVNAMTCDITVENACKEKTQSQNICWILAHQHHHVISVEHLLGSHVLCMTCFDGIDCIE